MYVLLAEKMVHDVFTAKEAERDAGSGVRTVEVQLSTGG